VLAAQLLQDQICLVTGAGNGIGAGTARLFAEHGATVVVVDIDEPSARRTAEAITADGGLAEVVVADVTKDADIARMRARVLDAYGQLDVLVNNVGHWVRLAPFVEGGAAHWAELYEINLLHVFRVTDAFLPGMLARRHGAIINVSSNEGVRGYPVDSVYSAFKAAVIQFTKSLGIEVAGQGVRVNGIAPDMTATQQSNFPANDPPEWAAKWPTWVPVGRMGEPADQARVVLFLASELAGFLTGQTILTDGGTTAAGGWYPTDRLPGRRWTNRPLHP
jgi:NAD(P)-dependent dehydrogenase (short-subunit alcohol dehydrogenase family)